MKKLDYFTAKCGKEKKKKEEHKEQFFRWKNDHRRFVQSKRGRKDEIKKKKNNFNITIKLTCKTILY